jgi:hypothetical protein
MHQGLHLAWSLIRIPHLAFSLFVFPLVLSLAIVVIQLIVTAILVQASSFDLSKDNQEKRITSEQSVVRRLLYGDGSMRPPLTVCRWRHDNTTGEEYPVGQDCEPDRLDVAIRVKDPTSFDVSSYVTIFGGQVDRLHVCASCQPDVVIQVDDRGARSLAYSVFGLAVLSLPFANSELTEKRIEVRKGFSQISSLLGGIHFYVPEIPGGIDASGLKTSLPIVFNVTILIVITLWLALRAHRKVLDYFAQNNVLLPLVAACGKHRFYRAIWTLTLARVGCFLAASLPLTYLGLVSVLDKKALKTMDIELGQGVVWLCALVTTLALATVMASLAELKHRHNILSFLYRYVPIMIAFVGGLVWTLSLLSDADVYSYVRSAVAALPVIGMVPILVAPVLNISLYAVASHAFLSTALLFVALKYNARWFAAHLEEI